MGGMLRAVSSAGLLCLMAMVGPSIQVQPSGNNNSPSSSDCGNVTLTANSVQVSPYQASGYASGTTITVACQTGYVQDVNTADTATCSGSGQTFSWTWTPAQLTCSIGCSPVTLNSQTVQVSPADASGYATDTLLTLGCASGYVPDSATSTTATCSQSLTWSWGTTQLTCSQGCPPVTLSPNTMQSSPTPANGYAVGTTLMLACKSGYYQTADSTTTANCVASNAGIAWVWASSLAQLTCSNVCPAPALASFQQLSTTSSASSSSSYAVLTSVAVSCITGYSSLTGSSLSITCETTLTWTPPPTDFICQPNCQSITANSKSTQTSPQAASSYAVGTQVTMACSSGYIPMAGTAVNATCSNGQWIWGDGNDLKLSCFQGCNPPDVSGVVITPNTTTYAIGANITIKCDTGYINTTSGRTSATCNSTGVWQWTGNGTPVACVQTCAVPVGSASMSYVITTGTVYIIGNSITAKCANGYSNSSGSNTLFCSTGGIWTWKSPGALTCLKTCTAPQTLPASLKYMSSKTATYMEGDTFTIGCNTGYVYSSGNESAVCSSSGTWIWNGGSNLTCVATCTPPVPGAFSSATPASNKTVYLANDVVNYVCNPGYMYTSGGTTGTCTGVNTWTWSNAATGPQVCIVIPTNMGATSGYFSNGTCDHYVLRSAVTDATCLISCLYDDYCNGYALVGANCYHERPQLASAVAAMTCQTR